MKLKTKFIIFCATLFLTSFSITSVCLAENIRKPAYAGSFYPAGKSEIGQTIEILTSKAKETRFTAPAGKSLKALILPHAGYVYSGLTASHASLVLYENQFSKVIHWDLITESVLRVVQYPIQTYMRHPSVRSGFTRM